MDKPVHFHISKDASEVALNTACASSKTSVKSSRKYFVRALVHWTRYQPGIDSVVQWVEMRSRKPKMRAFQSRFLDNDFFVVLCGVRII